MGKDKRPTGSKYHTLVRAVTGSVVVFLFSSIGVAEDDAVYKIVPETAALTIDRADVVVKSVPIVTRTLRRLEKERGIFGTGWCSNIDLSLAGVDVNVPAGIELHDCVRGQTRGFRKLLDAWIEPVSSSRILKRADGKWELTEAPHAIFRRDGKLDSFLVANQVRWYVRRDTASNIESLDNLKDRPIKFRRSGAGDINAILDGSGQPLITYRLTTMLEMAEPKGGAAEIYEYDVDGNILKISRAKAGTPVQLWRFAYTNSEWVATVHQPDGCLSRWIFDRSVSPMIAKESKSCREETLGTSKPVAAVPVLKRTVASTEKGEAKSGAESDRGPAKPGTAQMLTRPGPLGVGAEKAAVTLNREGLPVLFEILGSNNQVRRLEIQREDGSGTALKIRTQGVEVDFQNKPRKYEPAQLDLLDDYETWMSTWGSR